MNLSVNLARLLLRLIEAYIEQAKPIGSATLQQYMADKNYATATLRHHMAKLEQDGWLQQPHTSAGRIPTSKALRWYVAHLQQSKLTSKDRDHLAQQSPKPQVSDDTFTWSRQLASLLAELTQHMVLIAVPRFWGAHIAALGLIRLQSHLLLAYIACPQGRTHQTCLTLQQPISAREVTIVEQQLRAILLHRPLRHIRQELQQPSDSLGHDRQVQQFKLRELASALLPPEELHVCTAGLSHLLGQPEFQQTDRLLTLLSCLQDQATLSPLVRQLLEQTGIRFVFGQEHALPQLQETACVAMTIAPTDGHPMTVGLLGPQRMNYRRLMPVLAYTGDLVQQYWATC